MRKKYIFGKKLYISVLTSILVLLTTVATTFAWVGVFANSTFEQVMIGIKSSVLEEYSIQISLTGEEGTFSDSIPFSSLYKQILINCGYDENILTNNNKIQNLFQSLDLDQCTTLPNIVDNKIKSFGTFYDLHGFETHMYLKFDLYLSCVKAYDKSDASDFNLDVYLGDGLLTGSIKNHTLVNKFTYPDEFINPLSSISLPGNINPLIAGDVISIARTNSASAARVGFEKYEVVDRGHPEQYGSTSKPISAMIYQTDSDYPYQNTGNGVYSFGGILPDDYNLATMYYNSTEWQFYDSHGTIKSVSLPDEMNNARGVEAPTKDLVLSSNTNHLIDAMNPNEQIGIDDMMKITVYFWYEGWDADCIPSINYSPVNINISLNMSNEIEF